MIDKNMQNKFFPLVSVCIPVYNVEKYIKRCIKSIQAQSYKNLEIVVVNDCTPDGSMAIVEQIAKEDQRIKLFTLDNNSGLMFTRRKGYLEAKGDYIVFCDSDDALPNNAVEKLLLTAVDKDADVVIGNLKYIGDKTLRFNTVLKYGNDKLSVYKSLLRKEATHNLCGKIFKREVLQNYQYKTYLKCTNSEDMGAFFQIVNNCNKIFSVNEDVYYYYQNDQSSSNMRLSDAAINSMFLMRKTAIGVLSQHPQLHGEMVRWIIKDLSVLFPEYNHNNYLKKKTIDYGLYSYLSVGNVLKYVEFPECLRCVAKIYYPFFNK